jgi:RNA polymerase sigma factor (sigma-70 family)
LPTDVLEGPSKPRVTDDELVERSLGGDSLAFDELVRRHAAAVYRAALAALRSPPDAEDVMQETFVLAFQKLRLFRHEASFKTWLLTIAWRRALRKRAGPTFRVKRLMAHDADLPATISSHEPSAEQALIAGELYRDVRRLIRTLPARLRDPLLLAASGRFSHEELSDILGIPTGTVKWRVSEARRLLRLKLARLGHS